MLIYVDCIFPYFPLDRLDLDPHFIHFIHHETPPGCTCAPTHLAPSCHPKCSQLPAPEWRLAPRGQRMMGEGNQRKLAVGSKIFTFQRKRAFDMFRFCLNQILETNGKVSRPGSKIM